MHICFHSDLLGIVFPPLHAPHDGHHITAWPPELDIFASETPAHPLVCTESAHMRWIYRVDSQGHLNRAAHGHVCGIYRYSVVLCLGKSFSQEAILLFKAPSSVCACVCVCVCVCMCVHTCLHICGCMKPCEHILSHWPACTSKPVPFASTYSSGTIMHYTCMI